MDSLNFELLLRIFIAHLLSDFIFQTNRFVVNKEEKGLKSPYFYIHILITGITVYILLWNLNMWLIALIIAGTHFVIDAIKCQIKSRNIWIFLLDQLLHIIVIIVIWLAFSGQFSQFFKTLINITKDNKLLWLLLAYIFLSVPTSKLISFMTKKWSDEIDKNNEETGLKDAGKWIGIIERFLIFTFVIIGQITVTGFLLAAKSVFRFGNLNNPTEHKKTEYIIIGTFISFSIAILVGLLFKNNINWNILS